MKLLIFSDIHGDLAALERLMAIEADLYIAAGDLASWGRGLDRCGDLMRSHAGRVWVLPGSQSGPSRSSSSAAGSSLNDFHGKTFEAAGRQVAGLGYSNPTPFHTPGEYTEEELARRLAPFAGLEPLILVCHCPPFRNRARPGAGGRARGQPVGEALYRSLSTRPLLLRAYTRSGGRRGAARKHPRGQCGQTRLPA